MPPVPRSRVIGNTHRAAHLSWVPPLPSVLQNLDAIGLKHQIPRKIFTPKGLGVKFLSRKGLIPMSDALPGALATIRLVKDLRPKAHSNCALARSGTPSPTYQRSSAGLSVKITKVHVPLGHTIKSYRLGGWSTPSGVLLETSLEDQASAAEVMVSIYP